MGELQKVTPYMRATNAVTKWLRTEVNGERPVVSPDHGFLLITMVREQIRLSEAKYRVRKLRAKRKREPPPEIYRIRELQEAFGMNATTLYRMAWEGRLPSVKVGRWRYFPKSALKALLKKGYSLNMEDHRNGVAQRPARTKPKEAPSSTNTGGGEAGGNEPGGEAGVLRSPQEGP